METQTQTIPARRFDDLKVGETVTRMLGGRIPLLMIVVKVTEEKIYCGVAREGIEIGMTVNDGQEYEGWIFCRCCGAEIDEYLNWGHGQTGSYLKPCEVVQ